MAPWWVGGYLDESRSFRAMTTPVAPELARVVEGPPSPPSTLKGGGSPLKTPVVEGPPSPPSTSKNDPGLAKDSPIDCSSNKPLGHHGGKTNGGNNKDLRVLCCSNVALTLDYEGLYEIMKKFGIVERMKLKLTSDKASFICCHL